MPMADGPSLNNGHEMDRKADTVVVCVDAAGGRLTMVAAVVVVD